jgi:Ala-tRNA(Pro) deacylase
MNVDILLRRHGMPFSKTTHPPVFSSERLAAESHTPGQNVAKPVLVAVGPTYVLCVVPAHKRVSLEAVARAMHVESARLASEHELARIFHDCELGAEPPFGKPYGVPTLMDELLRSDEFLVFQAGSHTEAVRMLRADYERVAEPLVASIAY